MYQLLGHVKTLIETRQASSNNTRSCTGKRRDTSRIHDDPDVCGGDYLALGKCSSRPADRTAAAIYLRKTGTQDPMAGARLQYELLGFKILGASLTMDSR
jgi:hypothetical protein